jgi:toxin ParE1/3/4
MREVRLSELAELDIDQIAAYTLETWGADPTDRYLAKLEDGFIALAKRPMMGRRCDSLVTGLRRFEIE